MTQDGDGKLWIGTPHGLHCLQNNRFQTFYKKNQLSSFIIRDIYIDRDGILWLGTREGLLYYDSLSGYILTYPRKGDFSTASIYRILEDDRNNLWMTSNKGIFCVPRIEFSSLIDESARRKPPRYFHLLESDGLKTSAFSSQFQPAGCKTADGRLWFPSLKGACIIEPSRVEFPRTNIPVIIERVVVDGRDLAQNTGKKDRPALPEETSSIAFYFNALNLKGVENMKFKYHLSGNNPKANAAGREGILPRYEKKAVFRELPPGNYKFTVTAGNPDKGWTERAASYDFIIKGAFSWGEKLVFLLVGFMGILAVAISKFRERRGKENEILRIFKDDARYKTSGMPPDRFKKYAQELLTVMEEEKPYLDPEMSVSKMANRLGIPKENISQLINQRFYMNFNQFLNKYRVEEAKRRLLDPKESQFVVLKIAHDVGFNSKSTFNSAFKKFAGMSPSQWRQKHQKEKS
jgi:AraC-like DNA-binding protein